MFPFIFLSKKIVGTMFLRIVMVIMLGLALFFLSIPNALAALHNPEFTFNASGDKYVSISDANQTGLDITGDMTIAMWVKPSTLSGHMILASKWNHIDKTSYLLYLEDGDVGVALNANSNGYGYKVYRVAHGKNANEWFHIAMVYEASQGTVEFFIDGTSIGKSNIDLMPNSIANTDADFVIGGRDNKTNFYDGNIDDVRIWSRTLTGTMINDLYQNPNSYKNGEMLQGFWKFNGNLKDYSGNKNHLTIQ